MGIFDFFKKKKKAEHPPSAPAKPDHSAWRPPEEWERPDIPTGEPRAPPRPEPVAPAVRSAPSAPPGPKNPSYERIHLWIESRIGSLGRIPPGELHQRMMGLLAEEKAQGGPDAGSSPYAGLEAYIRTNAYRKMLN